MARGTGESERPALRVVRGEPSAEEIAALVAVLATLGGGRPSPPPARAGWADRATGLCAPVHAGPGGWARSGGLPGARTRADW